MTTVTAQMGFMGRMWSRYLAALKERPVRTKMITSGSLYVVGDCVAQFGIEGRSFNPKEEEAEHWDPWRTLRLTFYGGFIFAPLAHTWLGVLERIQLSSKASTLIARLSVDSFLWSPFVCALFPSSLGLLEGKNLSEVERKVQHSWFPTWQKAVAVFGPTQILNLTLVPPQHRLLALQSVGLGWNTFLSWQNNLNNKRLAAAEEALLHADTAQEAVIAQKKVDALEKKKKRIQEEEGGGAVGVATRMSWS